MPHDPTPEPEEETYTCEEIKSVVDRTPWIAAAVGAIIGAAALVMRDGEVVDLQKAARNVKYGSKAGSLAGRVKRDIKRKNPERVNGITLHQWGVRSVGAGAHRKVTAHYSVGMHGTVYRVHPLDTWLAGAHGLNGRTIQIEIAGLYGKNSRVPDVIIRGAQQAVRLAQADAARAGLTIENIWAHRQSSSGRGADPGPDIWARVAVPSGLRIQRDRTFGTGLQLPDHWFTPVRARVA